MKPTQKQINELDKAYCNFVKKINDQLTEYRLRLVFETLKNEEVKFDHDYTEFGKEAVLYKLSTIVAESQIDKQVRDILNDL